MLLQLSLLTILISAIVAQDSLPPRGGTPGRPGGPFSPPGPGPHGPGPHGPGPHGPGPHGPHSHSHGSSEEQGRTRPSRPTRRPVTHRPVTDQPQPSNQTQSVDACGLCTADSITIPTVDSTIQTTWFSEDEITQAVDGCLVREMTCMSATGIQTVVSFNDDTLGTVVGMGSVSINLNCNEDSEWTFMKNGVTKVITSITCVTA